MAEGITRIIRPVSTVEYHVDPEIGQTLVANQQARWVHEDYNQTVTTNSAGFHDYEHAVWKPRNVYRVIVVGDSFIEALSAPIESGFTQQLEQLLQSEVRDQRVEVINLGVGGIGPAQYLRILETKGMAYHPDVVIMSVFPDNDFWDSYEPLSAAPSKVFYRLQPDGSMQYVPAQASLVTVKARPWLRKSAFLALLRTELSFTPIESWMGRLGMLQAPGVATERSLQWSEWGVYIADHPDPWAEAYRTTLHAIKSSHGLAVKAGAQFTIMLIGSVATVEDRWDEALEHYAEAKSMRWNFEAPFTAITELGSQAGFGVINLVRPFREDFLASKKSRSWPHDGHWNPAGNQLAAEVVSRHLIAHREQYHLPN
jgi:hypothetical protein